MIAKAVACGKKIRENPAFCFEQLSGAGKIMLSNSTIFPLSLIYRCSLPFLCLSISSLLLFMFDIFLGTRVRTGVVQVVMTLDYVV